MDTLTDWALANLATYGASALLFISFVGSLGIPFPITLVIIAAGASVRVGLLDGWSALAACVVGAALADHSEYFLGRLAQPWLRRKFGQGGLWQHAQAALNRQGAWAILLTRFWLMPLAPAVNVIAGSRYPLIRFLAFDVLGQLIWVLIYGGLGYLFASQWEGVSRVASTFSALSFALVILLAGGYALLRRIPSGSAAEVAK